MHTTPIYSLSNIILNMQKKKKLNIKKERWQLKSTIAGTRVEKVFLFVFEFWSEDFFCSYYCIWELFEWKI